MKRLTAIFLILVTLLSVCALSGCGNRNNTEGAVIICLDEKNAPKTVENFLKLVDAKFYDGLSMHRIIAGFMIQGGDPKADGTGGSDDKIEGEFLANGHLNSLWHKRGVISMARSKDFNSASSQFFICHTDENVSQLDGQYAAFGWVVEGMDVVDAIATAEYNFSDDNGAVPADEQPEIVSIRRVSYGDGTDGHAYVEIVFSYHSDN